MFEVYANERIARVGVMMKFDMDYYYRPLSGPVAAVGLPCVCLCDCVRTITNKMTFDLDILPSSYVNVAIKVQSEKKKNVPYSAKSARAKPQET